MKPRPPRPTLSDDSRDALDASIEDYLDGFMTPREAREFEARLTEPLVARALSEALAFRSLLSEMPPEAAPDGLTDRIEAALGVAEVAASSRAFPRLYAAISGAAWALRGPARLAAGSQESLRPMALAATPLTAPLGALRPPAPARPPLWRRVLRFGSGGGR